MTGDEMIVRAWLEGPKDGVTADSIHKNLIQALRYALEAAITDPDRTVRVLARLLATLETPTREVEMVLDFCNVAKDEGIYDQLFNLPVSPSHTSRLHALIVGGASPRDVLCALKPRN